MVKKSTYAATGIFALLALAGCGANNAQSPTPETSTVTVTAEASDSSASSQSSSESASSTAASSSEQDVLSAIDAVRQAHPDAQITSIGGDEGSGHWEVRALEGNQKLDFHVSGNDVHTQESESKNDGNDDIQDASAATVDIKDAISTAQNEKSGDVVSVNLDRLEGNNNQLVWEVSFRGSGDGNTVFVDAANGEIITF
jgi:uncharacterized membrane protein YkoI